MVSSSFFLPPVIQLEPSSAQTNHDDGRSSSTSSRRADSVPPRIPSLLLFLAFLHVQRIPLAFPPDIKEEQSSQVVSGASMEVRFGSFKGNAVALKRLRSDRKEWDHVNMMQDLLFELKVMTHESIRQRRSVAKLLAVGIDSKDAEVENIEPILVVEAADRDTPDLASFFRIRHEAGYITNELLASIIADIADGLHTLHCHRLVHSDLKPANILLIPDPSRSQKWTAKVADFGFCGVDASNDLALRGHTALWDAPQPVTPSTTPKNDRFKTRMLDDLYSFGLLAVFVALGGFNVLDMRVLSDDLSIEESKSSDWVKLAAEVALDWRYCHKVSLPAQTLCSTVLYCVKHALYAKPTLRDLRLEDVRPSLSSILGTEQTQVKANQIIPFSPWWQDPLDTNSRSFFGQHSFIFAINAMPENTIGRVPESWMSKITDYLNKAAVQGARYSVSERAFLKVLLQSYPEHRFPLHDRLKCDVAELQSLTQSLMPIDSEDKSGLPTDPAFMTGNPSHYLGTPSLQRLARNQTNAWASYIPRTVHNTPDNTIDEPSLLRCVRQGGSVRAVELILQREPDATVRACNGWNGLHYAARYDRPEFVDFFMARGLDINDRVKFDSVPPLHEAVLWGSSKSVLRLLECGADVNLASVQDRDEINRYTPLTLVLQGSTQKEHDIILEYLLNYNADLHHILGQTPIITLAVANPSQLEICLDHDPSLVHCKTVAGQTLLQMALSFLLHPDDQPARGISYISPLRICSQSVATLLRYGADVNEAASCGRSSLHYCLLFIRKRLGDLEMSRHEDYLQMAFHVVHLFGSYGADFYLKDPLNPTSTPLIMLQDFFQLTNVFSLTKPLTSPNGGTGSMSVISDLFMEENSRLFAKPCTISVMNQQGLGTSICSVALLDAPPGEYTVTVRVGHMTTIPKYQDALLYAQVCPIDEPNQWLKWTSRHGQHQSRIVNADPLICMLRMQDICPQKDTAYTILIGTVKSPRKAGLFVAVGLNRPYVGTSASGAFIEYISIQKCGIPLIIPPPTRIQLPSSRIQSFVNGR